MGVKMANFLGQLYNKFEPSFSFQMRSAAFAGWRPMHENGRDVVKGLCQLPVVAWFVNEEQF
jgi:hypothetical protein